MYIEEILKDNYKLALKIFDDVIHVCTCVRMRVCVYMCVESFEGHDLICLNRVARQIRKIYILGS